MALGLHLVVFPRLVINITHIGADIAVGGFHSHEARVEEFHHIADGVHRGHGGGVAAVVVEEAHLVGTIHFLPHLVGLVGIAGLENLEGFAALGYVFDEVGNHVAVFIAPGVALASHVVVEGTLERAHVFRDSLFGIALHLLVEGGVDFQTIRVGVHIWAVLFDISGHGLAEIQGVSLLLGFGGEVQFDGQGLEGVAFGTAEVLVLVHILQHHVAAPERGFGIYARIVRAGGLEEADKHGGLFGFQVARLFIEIGTRGRLDAVGVAAEVNGVGVHRQYLVLVVEQFEFDGYQHLLALLDEDAHARDITQQSRGILRADAEHILHQLLRDGGCAARMSHNGILSRGGQSVEIDAVVAVEAFVFGVYEGLEEDGRNAVHGHGGAVLIVELAYERAVGVVEFAGLGIARIHYLEGRGRLAEEPKEVQGQGNGIKEGKADDGKEDDPQAEPPRTAAVQTEIPTPEGAPSPPNGGKNADPATPPRLRRRILFGLDGLFHNNY